MVVEDNPPFDHVLYPRSAVPRRAKSDGVGLIRWQSRDHPFRRSTGAIIHRLPFFFLSLLALGIQLGGRANARISLALGEQQLDFLPIERIALRLVKWPFVPVEIEPTHRVQYRLDSFGR